MKIIAIITAAAFAFTTSMALAEIGVKIPFGPGSNPEKIEKLKKEETSGAWTGIGLIILGAAIVAAAIIIVNEVDDVTDDAKEEIDETQELLDSVQL